MCSDRLISVVYWQRGVDVMSEGKAGTPFPPEKRERLVIAFHPKRTGYIIDYIFGIIIFVVGLLSNVMMAAGWLVYTETSWGIGIAAIVLGGLITAAVEIHRRSVLYIITTWNVRARRGLFRKKTRRLFYDQISEIRFSIEGEKKPALTGDLEFYKRDQENTPSLVFYDTYSPDGLRELVLRFIGSTPTPPPWDHIER